MHARAIGRIVFALAIAACGGRTVPQAPPAAAPPLRVLACRIAEPLPEGVLAAVAPSGEPPITVTGDLDPALVRAVVRAASPRSDACYAEVLRRDPAREGTALVELSVLSDGSVVVDGVGVRGLDTQMPRCLATAFRTLAFPPLPGRAPVHVMVPLRFSVAPVAPPVATHASSRAEAWTPFARASAKRAADRPLGGLVAAIRALPLDACGSASGSLRAILAVDATGAVAARAGGLGDGAAEACVAAALATLHVAGPAADIACDFTRGDAQPWRVTPGAGYDVLAVSRDGVRSGGALVAALGTPITDGGTALVLADPDAPGDQLAAAFALAAGADSVVLAVRSGAAALFVGAAATHSAAPDALWAAAQRPSPALRVSRDTVSACSGERDLGSAPLSSPGDVDALVAAVAEICGARACAPIRVSLDPAVPASATLEIAAALRLAGLSRAVYGAPPTCAR